jgi:hypothetical protein
MPTSSIRITVLSDEASKYSDSAKCLHYVDTNAESHCVEFYLFCVIS